MDNVHGGECPDTDDSVRQLATVCGMRLVSDPYDADALFTKGLILAKLGNIEGAVEILSGVMASNPEYPGGWRVLGSLYQMLGNLEMSRECINKSSLYVE